MNPCESPGSEAIAEQHVERTWTFGTWFAAVGFLAGGSIAFYSGYCAFSPPPLPPGTAGCGNAVLGSLVMMVLGTPVAAIVSSLVAGAIGGILDCILRTFD